MSEYVALGTRDGSGSIVLEIRVADGLVTQKYPMTYTQTALTPPPICSWLDKNIPDMLPQEYWDNWEKILSKTVGRDLAVEYLRYLQSQVSPPAGGYIPVERVRELNELLLLFGRAL